MFQGCSLLNTTDEKLEFDCQDSDLSVSSDYRQGIIQSKSQPVHEIFKNFKENWGFCDFGKFSQQIVANGNEWKMENYELDCQSFDDEEFSELGKSESLARSFESNGKTSLTLTDVDMSPGFVERFEESEGRIRGQGIDQSLSSISRFISNDRSKLFKADDSIDQIFFSLENPTASVKSPSLPPQNSSISSNLAITSSNPQSNPLNIETSSSSLYSPNSSFSMQSSFNISSKIKQANPENPLNPSSHSIFSFTISNPGTNNTLNNSSVHTEHKKKQENLTSDWSKFSGFSQSMNEYLNLTTSGSEYHDPNQMTDIKSQQLPIRKKFRPVEYWKNEQYLKDSKRNVFDVERKNGVGNESGPRKQSRKKTEDKKFCELGPVNGLNVWFFPKDKSKMEDYGEWKQGLVMENGKVRARNVLIKVGCEFCECSGLDCLVRMVECQRDSVIFELQGMKNYFNKEDLAYVVRGCKFSVVNMSQKTVKLLVFQFN